MFSHSRIPNFLDDVSSNHFSSFSPLCEKEHPSGAFGQLGSIHVDVVGLLALLFFFIAFAIIGFFLCNKEAASVALLPFEVARPSNMASIVSLFDSTIVTQFSATTMISASRNHCDTDVFILFCCFSLLLIVQRHLPQLIATRVGHVSHIAWQKQQTWRVRTLITIICRHIIIVMFCCYINI